MSLISRFIIYYLNIQCVCVCVYVPTDGKGLTISGNSKSFEGPVLKGSGHLGLTMGGETKMI